MITQNHLQIKPNLEKKKHYFRDGGVSVCVCEGGGFLLLLYESEIPWNPTKKVKLTFTSSSHEASTGTITCPILVTYPSVPTWVGIAWVVHYKIIIANFCVWIFHAIKIVLQNHNYEFLCVWIVHATTIVLLNRNLFYVTESLAVNRLCGAGGVNVWHLSEKNHLKSVE